MEVIDGVDVSEREPLEKHGKGRIYGVWELWRILEDIPELSILQGIDKDGIGIYGLNKRIPREVVRIRQITDEFGSNITVAEDSVFYYCNSEWWRMLPIDVSVYAHDPEAHTLPPPTTCVAQYPSVFEQLDSEGIEYEAVAIKGTKWVYEAELTIPYSYHCVKTKIADVYIPREWIMRHWKCVE